ncbi:hypothetical protein C8R42DRAFT_142280 [Lentinula raphanica]|nr:hypothetical protein C8R42DRAFT_142280 [Lentinula raphanica]
MRQSRILRAMSAVALSILKSVQGAKENQAGLGELAKLACDLASSVLSTYQELHPTNPGSDTSQDQSLFSSDSVLNSHVEQLVETFRNIDDWITGVKSRKLVFRLISYKSDVREIQRCRNQLRDAMDKFQLLSSITVRSSVARIASQQDKMEKDTAGQHKLLREIHEGLHICRSPMTNLPTTTLTTPISNLENTNISHLATTAPHSTILAKISKPGSIQGSVFVNSSTGNGTSNMIGENIKDVSNGQNINRGKWVGRGRRRRDTFWDRLIYRIAFFF